MGAGEEAVGAYGGDGNELREMMSDSLKSVSMDNGLQYNAIYWETGHRTFLPFYAPFRQKFTWKIIDDQVHNFLKLSRPITATPYVFYNDSAYFRQYYGDPDLSLTMALKKHYNFSFYPAGVACSDASPDNRRPSAQLTRTDIFAAVLESAFRIDFHHQLNSAIARNQIHALSSSMKNAFAAHTTCTL